MTGDTAGIADGMIDLGCSSIEGSLVEMSEDRVEIGKAGVGVEEDIEVDVDAGRQGGLVVDAVEQGGLEYAVAHVFEESCCRGGSPGLD